MKFIKPEPKYKIGDVRIIRKFLFTPIRIGRLTRWLEYATIKQELHWWCDVTCGAEGTIWKSIEFIK